MKTFKSNVTPEKEKSLHDKMESLGIRESDILERFVRSQGHGGQHVNKTATCVYLKHIPTGIEVKCQQERSQSMNRFFARRILIKKIENIILGKASDEQQRIEKLRRQKRKRTKRAQEKILQLKHHISNKKKERTAKADSSDYL